MTMDTPERRALAEAISDLQAAQSNLAQAQQVLQKARNLHCALVAQLSEFDDLAEDIAAARAENLKLALANGEAHPIADDPAGFAVRKNARDRAEKELQGVSDSLPILESELESARETVVRREHDRDMMAEKVFVSEFENMAEDFNAQLLEIRAMSYALAFAAYVQVRRGPNENVIKLDANAPLYGSGPMRRVNMPQAVNMALQENVTGLHEVRHGFRLRDASQVAVQKLWKALQTDAGAQLEMPESIDKPHPPIDSDRHANVL